MAQIQEGTVTVTFNSTRVIASANADWTLARTAIEQGSPVFFSLIGADRDRQVPRPVAAVTRPNDTESNNWELTLVTAWNEATQAGVTYFIHKDFTPQLELPLPSPGDSNWAQMTARAYNIIDSSWNPGGSTPPAPHSFPTMPLTDTRVAAAKTLYSAELITIEENTVLEILTDGIVEIG